MELKVFFSVGIVLRIGILASITYVMTPWAQIHGSDIVCLLLMRTALSVSIIDLVDEAPSLVGLRDK